MKYICSKEWIMKEITKAQEEILKALWQINDGAVSDVLDILPDPKPAYNTVATVIKVLEYKGYIAHKTYGKTNVYYPAISKSEYAQFVLKETFKGLFNGSLNQMMSSFVKNKDVSIQELEELKQLLEAEIEKQKK
jgi:BlaI family transcriptional regulator, penicillinase repressor